MKKKILRKTWLPAKTATAITTFLDLFDNQFLVQALLYELTLLDYFALLQTCTSVAYCLKQLKKNKSTQHVLAEKWLQRCTDDEDTLEEILVLIMQYSPKKFILYHVAQHHPYFSWDCVLWSAMQYNCRKFVDLAIAKGANGWKWALYHAALGGHKHMMLLCLEKAPYLDSAQALQDNDITLSYRRGGIWRLSIWYFAYYEVCRLKHKDCKALCESIGVSYAYTIILHGILGSHKDLRTALAYLPDRILHSHINQT